MGVESSRKPGPAAAGRPRRGLAANARERLGRSLARLVEALGTPALADTLLDFVRTEAGCDSGLLMVYRRRRRPEVLAEALGHALRKNSAAAYLSGAYLLDPFYLHARRLESPAFLRLKDIAPGDFLSTEYFSRYYKDSNLVDEVNYLVPLAKDAVLAVSLGRSQLMDRFGRANLARLAAWLPLVAGVATRHFEQLPRPREDGAGTTEHARLESTLGRFASSRLTPREHQTTQLLLKGYSAPLIAERLGVSVETVRVHRRNVYEKLDISSLAELFSLALQALHATGPEDSDPLEALERPPGRP